MRFLRRAALALLLFLVAVAALFAIGVLWPLARVEPVRTTQPVVIANVTIIDVRNGTTVPGQTVVIEGNRIRATGAAVNVPPNARVIDGRGRFLMPALWDMHTHVFAVTPLLDLPLYIAYGVTNVRDMQSCPKPGDPFAACPEDKRQWSRDAAQGRLVGPRVVASASWMANGPGMAKRLGDVPAYFDTATPEQGRQFVRHFAGKVEAIKAYNFIPRDAYLALADEARRAGMDVVGHRPYAVRAIEAAAHQKSIDHARFILHESFPGAAELRANARPGVWKEDRRRMLDQHDPAMAQAIFAAMKQHGTWYVPTHLTRWVDAYADDPLVREDPMLRYLHPLMKRQWLEDVDEVLAEDPSPAARQAYRDFYRKGLELTGAAHRAGVKILAGTDYIVAGADLHRELRQLALAGMPPADILRAAITSPAEYFGLEAQYGSVAPGYAADLLLLTANPLENVANSEKIEAVIFNGNLYDAAKLREIHQHVERQARSWTVACKIVWRFLKNPAGY